MFSLQYVYLPSILLLLPMYLFLYYRRKDIRHKMLRLAMYGAIAGPISQYWYLQDYWHPTYTLGTFGILEDMLFAALVCGVSGGVINTLLNVTSIKSTTFGDKWSRVVLAVGVVLASLLVLTNVLGLDSIYASAIGFILLASIIWYQRPDLFKASMLGMAFWIFTIIVGYNIILLVWPTYIQEWWMWSNISGLLFIHIPLEEYLWFGTWGLVGSVVYEWKGGRVFSQPLPF